MARSVGIGSALGPILGGLLYERFGFISLLNLCIGLSVSSFFLLFFAFPMIRQQICKKVPPRPEVTPHTIKILIKTWPLMFASIIFSCLLGQSFSYIPIMIEALSGKSSIAIFFSTNALCLVLMAVPLVNYLNKRQITIQKKCMLGQMTIGLSLIILPFLGHSFLGIIFIALIYSVGEILFASYSLEMLRATLTPIETTKGLAIHTFLTVSLGLGLGQYLGVLLKSSGSVLSTILFWVVLSGLGCFFIGKTHHEKNSFTVSS